MNKSQKRSTASVEPLERRALLSGTPYTYVTDFTKNNNIYTNLNEQFPHTGTGVPGSGVGTANASFLFDPTPAAVTAAGYAPGYVAGSDLVNNGVPFELTSNAAGQDFGQYDGSIPVTVATSANGVHTVYLLMGTYDGQSFGITFTGADGTTQSFTNVQLPDFNGGSIDNTTNGYADQTVFQVNDVGAGGSGNSVTGDTTNYGLTEVAFPLPASLSNQQLSSFTINSNGYDTLLLGVTLGGTPVKSIGGLDPGFGTSGLASHDVGFTSTNGVATDGTQSVLIGPVDTSAGEAFGVTRFNSDGTLDTSFGTAGVTTTSFGSSVDVPTAVDVLSDGNILVAGTATTPGAGSEFAVAEYNTDGSLDTSFGTGGMTLVSFSPTAGTLSNDVLQAMAVASNGLIYLGGSSDAAGTGHTDFAVAALSPTGSAVAGFGNKGIVTTDIAGGDDVINSLAVQGNGNVVAAGAATVNGVGEVALARFGATGKLDTRFGSKGIVTEAVGTVYDSAASVVVQPKGQIVVGGLTASGTGAALASEFLVQRFTAAGKLDRTFGSGGTVTTAFDQVSAVTQLALQADGSIIASGKTSAALGGTLDVAIARYTTRGALDTGFDGTGTAIIDLGSGIVPAVASTLGAAFDAFVASEQGTVGITQGGEILTAGSSGANTVEAELIAAGVDLLTKVLSTFPTSVLGGAKGKISVSVTESGTTAAKGSVTITIEFAADPAGDNPTGAQNFAEKLSLKQGQSKTYKLTFTYPTLGASDFVVADVTNGVGVPTDLDPTDNQAAAASAVAVAPAFVQLLGADLTASPIVAGIPASFVITITNAGNVTAKGKSEVDFYLSGDGAIADGTLLGSVPLVVSLPAGKSKPYRLKLTAAGTLAAGTFNLLAVIDPNNSLGSDDASDSLVASAVTVTVN